MADLVNQSALAIVKQPGTTRVNPTTADILPVSNLRPQTNTYTIENPEYTGSVHKFAPFVMGKGQDISFTTTLRGPGGATPPALDAFLLGRLLQALGMTEVRLATALPAAPEALGGGSTTTVATLGATAAATLDLYTGLPLFLSAAGVATSPKSYSMIRSYAASKAATLMETFGAAITGNYQIPPYLGYLFSSGSTPPALSMDCWRGGRKIQMDNMICSSATFNFTTSNRENVALNSIDWNFTGNLTSDVDEFPPVAAVLGVPPAYRDGDFWLSAKSLCIQGFSVTVNNTVAFPPCPAQPNGNDPGQITTATRAGQVTLNQVRKSTIDLVALADAQGYHGIWGQFGLVGGNTISVGMPQCRLSYPNDAGDGDFVQNTLDLYLDGPQNSISLMFPYF